jgi:hypothetical protein
MVYDSVFGIVTHDFNIVNDNVKIERDNFRIATNSLFRSIEILNDHSSTANGSGALLPVQ